MCRLTTLPQLTGRYCLGLLFLSDRKLQGWLEFTDNGGSSGAMSWPDSSCKKLLLDLLLLDLWGYLVSWSFKLVFQPTVNSAVPIALRQRRLSFSGLPLSPLNSAADIHNQDTGWILQMSLYIAYSEIDRKPLGSVNWLASSASEPPKCRMFFDHAVPLQKTCGDGRQQEQHALASWAVLWRPHFRGTEEIL